MNIPDYQVDAYKSMYLLENKLRLSLHNHLSRKFGDNYFRKDLFTPFEHDISEKTIDVVSRIESRVRKETQLLGKERGIHQIWFLDYKVLIILISHYWDSDLQLSTMFNQGKTEDKDYLVRRLQSLVEVRNDIAHNRIVDRIGANDIESVLNDITNNIKGKYLEVHEIVLNRNSVKLLSELMSILMELISVLNNMGMAKLSPLISIRHTLAVVLPQRDFTIIVQRLEIIIELLKNYNELRRPNQPEVIEQYLDENQLFDKISELICEIERLTDD